MARSRFTLLAAIATYAHARSVLGDGAAAGEAAAVLRTHAHTERAELSGAARAAASSDSTGWSEAAVEARRVAHLRRQSARTISDMSLGEGGWDLLSQSQAYGLSPGDEGQPLSAAEISAIAATSQSSWITEHHDGRNSGLGDWVGPGETSGTCVTQLANHTSILANAPIFASTGVLSVTNEYLYAGDSANTLYIIEVETFAITKLNLTTFGQRVNYGAGIRGSASNKQMVVFNPGPVPGLKLVDRVTISSSDGHIYSFNMDYCLSQQSLEASIRMLRPMPASRLVSGSDEHRSTGMYVDMDEWHMMYGSDPLTDVPCLAWVHNLTHVSYGPTRWAQADGGTFLNGLIYATETDPNLNGKGVLHAYSLDNGTEIWNLPATFISGNTTLHYGLRVVPAVDPFPNSPYLFMGWGPQFAAIRQTDGYIAAVLNDTKFVRADVANDIFVSSPAMTADGSAVFVHSSAGTLWRIAVTHHVSNNATTNVTTVTPSMTISWGCDYTIVGSPICVTAPASEERRIPHVIGDKNGNPIGRRMISPAELVPGGFYQPTTYQEREELHAAIRFHYAALVATIENVSFDDIDVFDADVYELARALPLEILAAIVTPSGYRMRSSTGKPLPVPPMRMDSQDSTVDAAGEVLMSTHDAASLLRLGAGGTFPYATPSFSKGDARIFVAQYTDFGRDSGIFAVNPVTGAQIWAFQNYTYPSNGIVVPFGTSRSSPAVDQNGYVFVGTDADQGAYTLPLLLALAPNGTLMWMNVMGKNSVVIGASSPIVGQGFKNESRVYMASAAQIVAVDEGVQCPTTVPFAPCSGGGTCNCKTGQCTCFDACHTGPGCQLNTCSGNGICENGVCVCNPCYSGPDCSILNTCSGNGVCNPATGLCQCTNCTSGSDCSVPNTCSGQGTCNPTTGQCQCNNCYFGNECQNQQTCSGAGTCNPVTGTCSCAPCASGTQCETQCGGGGTCNGANGVCTCNNQCMSGSTCSVANTCNNQGFCNPINGGCTCNSGYGPGGSGACLPCTSKCYYGQNCASTITCNGRGACQDSTGQCQCTAGYDPLTNCATCDPCHSGPTCSVANTCSGHGTCSAVTGLCACSGGYSGASCSNAPPSGVNAGAIAAGVLVPVTVLGIAGALFFWKLRNPGLPFSSLLPSSGGSYFSSSARYSQVPTATSASYGAATTSTGARGSYQSFGT